MLNPSLNGFTLILSVVLLAGILLSVSIVPSVLASSNSGPGRGDDESDDISTTPSQDPSTVTNSIIIPLDAESHSAANPYSPRIATVSSGSTVTWLNTDDEDQHSATADDGSFSTGILNPGQSGQAVINAPAGSTIAYHCDVHPEMRGILQVSAATNGGNADGAVSAASIQNSTSLGISDQPLAVGHYTTTSENVVNNTIQISVVGNTTINLPNSTETITTNDTGNVTLTMTESGGGILEGQVHLTTADGSENATVTVTEFFSSENAPGRGIASFSTDSTGKLAPLDGIVAIVLDEGQPDGSVRVSFFEWPLVNNQTIPIQTNPRNSTGGNQTTTITPPATTTEPVEGSTIEVSITPGSSSKTTNAYDPNPVEVNVGDKVIWTNDDSTPHTATSGQPGAADGMFGGEAGSFGTIIPPNGVQEFTFTEAGEFPYYCGLHPNMVGTVSVS